MKRARLLRLMIGVALISGSARAQHAGHGAQPAAAAPAEHAGHEADRAQHAPARKRRHPVLPPHERIGSGTSWLPDGSPMHAIHASAGDFMLMFHGNVSAGYNHQASDRGDEQVTVVSWIMAMVTHPLGDGEIAARAMLSADPFTLPGDGYPLLLQTGESWRGVRLHDRQHPHDLFMELAVLDQIPITSELGLEIYLAPVGEPAFGPTAYPHRLSAASDPLAPLGHHWHDSTHISYGVATLGVFGRRFKLEGSWFNGREPDERRTDFDFRRPDSTAARATLNPARGWSTQASWAFLDSPEELHPDQSVHRLSTSISNTTLVGDAGYLATTFALGVNVGGDDQGPAPLLEVNYDLDGHSVIFGRAELVVKSADALVLEDLPADERVGVWSLALGYQYAFGPFFSLTPALGARAAANPIPAEVEKYYGTHVPLGAMVYAELRPAAMRMHDAMTQH